MKKTFRIIYTTMAACLLFLTACQKDDEKQAVQQTTTSGVQVSTITFDIFKANAKAFAALQKAAGSTNKDITDYGKQFFYDNSHVSVAVYKGYTTYTFQIYRYTKQADEIENLVIRQSDAGVTDTYTVTIA